MAFLGRWTPESHFYGLDFSGDGIALKRNVFACCGGDGVWVDPKHPRDAVLCGLTRRWNLIFNTVTAWKTAGNPHWPDPRDVKSLEEFFKAYLDGFLRSAKGRVIETREIKNSGRDPQLPWLAAATMAWHFEVLPLIFRIGSNPPPLLRWTELMTRHPKARVVVFVDDANELWNANRLEALEAVVAFASEKILPVWLFSSGANVESRPATGSGARSFKASVNKRLEAARRKSPFEWLSDQGRSRLSEVCAFVPTPSEPVGIPDMV